MVVTMAPSEELPCGRSAQRSATHRRRNRLIDGRAETTHQTLGRLRRWLLDIIFFHGSVLGALSQTFTLVAETFAVQGHFCLGEVCPPRCGWCAWSAQHAINSHSLEAWGPDLVHTVRRVRMSVPSLVGGSLHGPCHITVARQACTLVFRGLTPRGVAFPRLVSVRSLCHLTPRWIKTWFVGMILCWMCLAKTFADHFAQDSLALLLVRAHRSRVCAQGVGTSDSQI